MSNSDQTAPPPSAVQACAQSIGADRRFYTTADRATAAGTGIVVTCEQWPPTPVVAFPSGADLPPVPTLLLAGDHDLITPWGGHSTRPPAPPSVASSSFLARDTSPRTGATARRAARPSPSS